MAQQGRPVLGAYCSLTGYSARTLKELLIANGFHPGTSMTQVTAEEQAFLERLIPLHREQQGRRPDGYSMPRAAELFRPQNDSMQMFLPHYSTREIVQADLSDMEMEAFSRYQTVILTSSMLFRKGTAAFLERLERAMQDRNLRIRFAVMEKVLRRCIEACRHILERLMQRGCVTLLSGQPSQETEILCDYCRTQAGGGVLALADDSRLTARLSVMQKNEQLRSAVYSIDGDGAMMPQTEQAGAPLFAAQDRAVPLTADRVIPIRGVMPGTGTTVHNAAGTCFRLGEKIGTEGAEGTVYEIEGDPKHCVKIFHEHTNTEQRHRKVRILADMRGEIQSRHPRLAARFSFPIEPVYNAAGDAVSQNPVGYVMKRFQNSVSLKALLSAVFLPHIRIKMPNPLQTKQDLIQIAESLCELAEFAERNNLVLGDALTAENILITQNHCVCFCDMDSVQFAVQSADGETLYGSSVGRDGYYSPERAAGTIQSSLHSFPEDAWSLQVLLFMILVTGSDPYIGKNSSGLQQDIAAGRYVYQNGQDDREYGLPGGVTGRYYCTMSYLPRYIQRGFYDAFSSQGAHFRMETRRHAGYWLYLMERYMQRYPALVERDALFGSLQPAHARQ